MAGWLRRGLRGDESAEALSKRAALDSLRYVVLDTELTSLDHRTNRLLSVGAVAMQGSSIHLGEQFYRVVNPQATIPAETVVIHKLRPEDVEGGAQLGQTLDDLCRFIDGAVLVGHFVEIELKILRKEMSQTGHKLDNPAIDTAKVHRWILRHSPYSEDLPVQLDKLDLPALASFYHLDVEHAHHALSDAFLTARVWQKMLHTLREKKVTSLDKLLKIGGI